MPSLEVLSLLLALCSFTLSIGVLHIFSQQPSIRMERVATLLGHCLQSLQSDCVNTDVSMQCSGSTQIGCQLNLFAWAWLHHA